MNDNHEPNVSVCMPVRNGMPHIRYSIESVIHQTFLDWELIICDNGSTDGSLEMARELAASHPDKNIRIIPFTEVCGMAENWNRAIEHAKGKYVKVLPCDDNLKPEALAIQTAALEANTHNGRPTRPAGSHW